MASIVGEKRVIAGSVEFGATFIEPGVSSLTTEYTQFKQYAFQIGELNGEITERIQRVKSVLDLVGGTHISNNLVGTKWSKLLINNAFSGLSAALNGEYGDILDHEAGIESAVHIAADETIKVAHANGIKFVKMNGFDIASLELHSEKDIPERVKTLRFVMGEAVQNMRLSDYRTYYEPILLLEEGKSDQARERLQSIKKQWMRSTLLAGIELKAESRDTAIQYAQEALNASRGVHHYVLHKEYERVLPQAFEPIS